MAHQALVLRVVLASPGDLTEEREVVRRTVSALNLENAHRKIVLELHRWEDCAPGASRGGSQAVLHKQLDILNADIFVGMFWNKYGTKTAKANSGTIDEFNVAYKSWKATGTPRLCMYFKRMVISGPASLTMDQMEIERFRRQLEENGQLLYGTFDADLVSFQLMLHRHLSWHIQSVVQDAASLSGFDRVFGSRAEPTYLVSGGFLLHERIQQSIKEDASYASDQERKRFCEFPLQKPSMDASLRFSASVLMGSSESRAFGHLAQLAIDETAALQLRNHTDMEAEVLNHTNRNLIALGAYSNQLSMRILCDRANDLVVPAIYKKSTGEWDGRFIGRTSGLPLHDELTSGRDLGLILKIAPSGHPDKTWILCGGLGEWGTSGAAYFLTHKWPKLASHPCLKRNPANFAALIDVPEHTDDDASLMWMVSSARMLKPLPEPEMMQLVRMDKTVRCCWEAWKPAS